MFIAVNVINAPQYPYKISVIEVRDINFAGLPEHMRGVPIACGHADGCGALAMYGIYNRFSRLINFECESHFVFDKLMKLIELKYDESTVVIPCGSDGMQTVSNATEEWNRKSLSTASDFVVAPTFTPAKVREIDIGPAPEVVGGGINGGFGGVVNGAINGIPCDWWRCGDTVEECSADACYRIRAAMGDGDTNCHLCREHFVDYLPDAIAHFFMTDR
jgi:hypothetical protein